MSDLAPPQILARTKVIFKFYCACVHVYCLYLSRVLKCIHCAGPRPTINELISMERRDGSRKKLEIIDEITSHKSTQCTDFAHKLLNHRSTVRRLQKNHTNDEEFIRAVLNNWLDRDDDDEQEESVPCSWEALIQCMNDAGLDGELVKVLRDNVPRGECSLAGIEYKYIH